MRADAVRRLREPLRHWLTAHLPSLLRLYRAARRGLRDRLASPAAVFGDIHRHDSWGAEESRSGPGSTLAATARLRAALPALVRDLGVHKLLDAGCGDFHWMKDTDLGDVSYTGVDVVPDLIARNRQAYQTERTRFVLGDVTKDPLPAADLILCRDCLIHLSNRHVLAALKNFRDSGARYLLANTYPAVARNEDITTGSFRPINLERPPFAFPPPLRWVDDDRQTPHAGAPSPPGSAARLALWDLERLRLP